MTGTVIALESRRRRPQEAATCEYCARSRKGGCSPHLLEALARRLTLMVEATEGELLISRDTLTAAVADARSVLDLIVAEAFPEDHRTTR